MFIIQNTKNDNHITVNDIQFPKFLSYLNENIECKIHNNQIIYKYYIYTITIDTSNNKIHIINDKNYNTSFYLNKNLKIITSENILEIIKFLIFFESMNLNHFKNTTITHHILNNLLNKIPKIISTNSINTFMNMDTSHKTLCMEIEEYKVIITQYFILFHKENKYFLLGENDIYYSITPHTSLQAIITIFETNNKQSINEDDILYNISINLYNLFGNCILYFNNQNIVIESLLNINNQTFYICPTYTDKCYYILLYNNNNSQSTKIIIFIEDPNIQIYIYDDDILEYIEDVNSNIINCEKIKNLLTKFETITQEIKK